jgi:hypothetical protein
MTLSTQDVPAAMIAEDGSEVEIPSNFLCPITLQVMVSPVMTREGLNFEKAAIFSWLEQGSGSCPLTRKPLAASDLCTDRRLKTQICFWKKKNGIPETTEEEMAAAECKFVGFLKISEIDKEEIPASHSQQPLSLALFRANNYIHSIPPGSTQRAARSSGHARQSGERRRNFLSRILTSATAAMEDRDLDH